MSGGYDWRAVIVAAYLALALTLGGGGSPNPWSELAVQLGGAALAAWWLASGQGGVWRSAPVELRWLAALVLAVPLLHLVPLPPAVWHPLPGRELVRGSLALVGAENAWRPLSVAPRLTLAGLLAMVPPVVLMLAVARLDRNGIRLCLLVVVAAALLSALLGAVQLTTGTGYFYAETHRGWITGVFANRNAAVDLFLIGAMAAFAYVAGAPEPRRLRPVLAAVVAILLAAAVLTGSRMGIVLLVLVAATPLAIWRGASPATMREAVAVMALGIGVALALQTPRFAAVLARFTEGMGFRTELWRDGWTAAQAFWPVGSGSSTFIRAFAPFERLAVVDASVPNRAHNDYLELLIEAGVLAPIILGAAAVLLYRLVRRANLPRTERLFALASLGIVAAHSVVDYPLRTMALASLAACAAGMLASAGKDRHKSCGIGHN